MVRAYQVSGRWRQSLLPGLSWSKVCHLIPTAIAGVIRSVLRIFTKPFGPENWTMRAFPLRRNSYTSAISSFAHPLNWAHMTITLAKSDLPFRSETHLLIFLAAFLL